MSLGTTGLNSWVIQRITAVFLMMYIFILMAFVFTHHRIDHENWLGLYQNIGMQLASFIALISLIFHAWIGLWTVVTDYLHSTVLRYSFLSLIFIILVGYSVWGFTIFWEL